MVHRLPTLRDCVRVEVSDSKLVVLNTCDDEVYIDTIVLQYRVSSLSYDRREVSDARRTVTEFLRARTALLPRDRLALFLRDCEEVVEVCIESRGERECYRPSRRG